VEFFTSDMADKAEKIPYAQREGTRVSISTEDMVSAYGGFRSMVSMALS